MLLSKLGSYLLARNGQHILGQITDVGFNMTALWAALEPEIWNYQAFVPLMKTFNIQLGGINVYDFTYDSNNVGYDATPVIDHSTTTLTITGTGFASGETVTFVTNTASIGGGTHSTVYTTISGDTSATVLAGDLATAINADTTVNPFLTATAVGVVITLVSTALAATTYTCTSTNGSEIYTFDTPVTVLKPVITGTPPTFIASCIPVNSITLISTLAAFQSPLNQDMWSPSRLIDPRVFIFEYRKPKMYVTELGGLDITAAYHYQTIVTTNSNGVITEVEIVDLEKSDHYPILLKILSGRFMLALARSRRAFTYQDLPIISDANLLAPEAQVEYDSGLQELYARHKWWESVRP